MAGAPMTPAGPKRTGDDNEASPPTLQELNEEDVDYGLYLAYKELLAAAPTDTIVLPDDRCVRLWHGAVFPSQGMYAGGGFRFVIGFPSDYPFGSSHPVLRFLGVLPFHPLVAPTNGETSSRFPIACGLLDGRKTHNALSIVSWAKRILTMSEKELVAASKPEHSLNRDAASLLAPGRVSDSYVSQCMESASLSAASLFVRNPPSSPLGAVRMRERALAEEERVYEDLVRRVSGTAVVASSPALSAARSALSDGGEPDGVILRAFAVVPSSHALESFAPAEGHGDLAAFLGRPRTHAALERFLLAGPRKGAAEAEKDEDAAGEGGGGGGAEGSDGGAAAPGKEDGGAGGGAPESRSTSAGSPG